ERLPHHRNLAPGPRWGFSPSLRLTTPSPRVKLVPKLFAGERFAGRRLPLDVVVQKYGGSSLSTPERIRAVARRVASTRRDGEGLVVVVSAMGPRTDELLALARQVSGSPPPRELDVLLTSGERVSRALLAMALHDEGLEAVSLSGPQAGVRTCGSHTHARITEVRPGRGRAELARGRVGGVAGFQGEGPDGEVSTLGRGGSDTTAVAMAAALQASRCDVCSDVSGVFSADPRLVEEARKLPEIGYEEMLELARFGARVLKTEAV